MGVAGLVYTVRGLGQDRFDDGRVIMVGFRFPDPTTEPRFGEVLRLPDGSGPWRVVDWRSTNQVLSVGNVLVVEFVGD